MTFSVNEMDVLLPLLRAGLPAEVTVMSKVPDKVPSYMPLVVCRRTGGSSFAPKFYDQPYINIQCWAAADRDAGVDASRAAHNLADDVRRVLWAAWDNQTVVAAGHIGWVRESQAPLESPDPDLPHHGRYAATYELLIRHALPA
jgi:hypothetical protein